MKKKEVKKKVKEEKFFLFFLFLFFLFLHLLFFLSSYSYSSYSSPYSSSPYSSSFLLFLFSFHLFIILDFFFSVTNIWLCFHFADFAFMHGWMLLCCRYSMLGWRWLVDVYHVGHFPFVYMMTCCFKLGDGLLF